MRKRREGRNKREIDRKRRKKGKKVKCGKSTNGCPHIIDLNDYKI
jgi:hypothetical protein